MRRLPLDSAARIACLYIAFAGLWIFYSDRVLAVLTQDPETLVKLQTHKVWLFVAATAVLLYLERRRADRGIRRLAAIVQSSDDAIIGKTLDGIITSWNAGAERIYGYSFDEVIGRDISMLVPPDQLSELQQMLERIRQGERVSHRETVRLRKDGERIHMSVTVSPIKDATGRLSGGSTIARDITDRRRADAVAKMADVGILASGLVHEIRNPLNAMRMQTAIIMDKLETPDEANLEVAVTQLSRLEGEVLRLHGLVSDFLAYGRPAADQLEEVTVPPLIREVVEFIGPDYANRQVKVEIDVAPEDEDTTVVIDRNKLRQVLLNLADNSQQAMPNGGVLSIRMTCPSAGWASVAVCDTGPGIPSGQLGRIFDAFYSTRRKGTGLGLAIVKQIIDAVDGTITVESTADQGTCFTIGLPTATPARRRAAQLPEGGEESEMWR